MSRVKKPRKPFRLYDMPFDSTADLNREITRRAQGVYLPKLEDVNRNIQSENRKTQGRTSDIIGYGQSFKDQLNKAYDQASKALATLSAGGAQNDEQKAVLEAAQSAQGRTADEAQRLGAVVPGQSQATGQAIKQEDVAGGNYLGGLSANLLAGADMYRNSVPQTMQNQQLATEDRRHAGILTGLQGQRSDILSQVGAAKAQARSDIINELLKTRAQQFQESVANKELGIKSRGLDIQEELGLGGLANDRAQLEQARKQFDWSKYVDRAKIRHDQAALDQAANQSVGANDEADRTAEAELYARGAEAVDSFLAANEGDKQTYNKKVNGRKRKVTEIDNKLYRKRRTPEQLYSSLRRLGLPQEMIYKLMGTVRLPGFNVYVKNKKGFKVGSENTNPAGTTYATR